MLVLRSTGTNAVYLLMMLQALLVCTALSWCRRPDPAVGEAAESALEPAPCPSSWEERSRSRERARRALPGVN